MCVCVCVCVCMFESRRQNKAGKPGREEEQNKVPNIATERYLLDTSIIHLEASVGPWLPYFAC